MQRMHDFMQAEAIRGQGACPGGEQVMGIRDRHVAALLAMTREVKLAMTREEKLTMTERVRLAVMGLQWRKGFIPSRRVFLNSSWRAKRGHLISACLAASLALQAQAQAQPQTLRVAAASNLKFVLADLQAQHWQHTGQKTEFSFGASVQLARQIQQGLPVQLFISADEEQVAWLAQAGLTRDAGQRYALGRLALISPQGSGIPVGQGLMAAVQALKPTDKFAIANPQLAPYGRAAQETLQQVGVWSAVQKQLVLGDHIGQATQFVLSGAAPLGITAYSLTLAPEAAGKLQVWPVPADLHAPLPQRLVLLKTAGPQAVAFRDFLLSPAARPVWLRHGYALPQ